jgi:hypothetical protein
MEKILLMKGVFNMKRKIWFILILLIIGLTLQNASAEERNFPAGSLIIPMDSYYQSDIDGGILEAYGLIYYLLDYLQGDEAITVYWVINQEKTVIDGVDCIIEDLTLQPEEKVVELYDHTGGTTSFTPTRPGDNAHRITYSGAPWIIDAADAEKAKLVIDPTEWAAVEVHVAQVPFKAPVDKELKGTPPKIALMDSSDNGGNADILESYLRSAGICPDVYDVLTPSEVRDGMLTMGNYEFMWAPHWHGDTSDNNGNGIADEIDIVNQVKLFLESGKGLLAECACIRIFENHGLFLTSGGIDENGGTGDPADIVYMDTTMPYSQIGNYPFAPEGGSLKSWRPFGGPDTYNDTVTRFAVDNTGWDYYVGGHPYGDRKNGYAVYLGGHSYASCGSPQDPDPEPNVTRLSFEFAQDIFDDPYNSMARSLVFEFNENITDENFILTVGYNSGLETTLSFSAADLNAKSGDPLEVDLTGAIVNGKKLENITFRNKGEGNIFIHSVTFSWAGGHAAQLFVKMTDVTTGDRPYDQPKVGSGVMAPIFGYTIVGSAQGDSYTILVNYRYIGESSTTISFNSANPNDKVGEPLEVDLTEALVNGKKITPVILRNTGTRTVVVESMMVSWVGGPVDQKISKIVNVKTGETLWNVQSYSGTQLQLLERIELPSLLPEIPQGCVDNDDCSWDNVAAVRYVLNTLFNIKFYISPREYVRASPVIKHPYLYQGSFDYPSLRGHFRRYNVTLSESNRYAEWDTAVGGIQAPEYLNNNPLSRKVHTARKDVDGSWTKIDFDTGNIAQLCSPLNITPAVCDDGDESDVIERVRGQYWNSQTAQWLELSNKLGAVEHSAPVIIGSEGRAGGSRKEIAYIGSLDGMLHAIETDTGSEKWAFIPSNLLEKLKNDRTNPNAAGNFAAVDASPAAKDVYYDHDGDGYKEWRTVLVSAEGQGGNSIFALDVTDPDDWSVLWEATDTQAPAGGMGHAYRVAIDKVKWPVKEVDDENGNGVANEILGYEMKWVVFLSTGYADIATNHGGIHVFAFDLKTGSKLWVFSAEYADSVNDIPGSATVFDIDGDSFADRVYVGDMNGRLWELDTVDGTNPNGQEVIGDTTKEIPLFNAGVGYPISVSPAVVKNDGHTVLVFGTGGADWASDAQTYAIFAVDATDKQSVPTYANGAGTLLWQKNLGAGEKVWSTPTVAYGYIFVATAFGSMEGSDPRMDIPVTGQASGNFLKLKLADGGLAWQLSDIGKVRGSIFVDRQHAYMTTIDGQVIQIGGSDFAAGTGNRVVLRTWRQM